jgi:hypothetical protein
MAALTPEQLEKRRKRDRKYYQSLTSAQIEKRRARGREYMKQKRAQLRAAKEASGSLQERAQTVPAPVTSAKPQTPATSTPVKSRKPTSERAKHREWRGNVVHYLADCLTDPACPLDGEYFESHRIGSMWLGFFDRLNQIESILEKRDMIAELRLCIAIEALCRLCGEIPAGTMPTTILGAARKLA